MRNAFAALLALVSLAGVAATPGPAPATRPVLLVVEGVGGINLMDVSCAIACRWADLPHEVRLFPWSHGFGRGLKDLKDTEHLLTKADELAGEVRRLREEEPDRPVYIVAMSGGTGLAVRAAEQLPPDTLERMVLLASALSPSYDLRPALAACRRGVVSYHSRNDVVVLGLGTRLFGTIDRQRVASAGLVGFRLPEGVEAQAPGPYARLIQVPWHAGMILDGNWGNHNAAGFPLFLAREVARWLR
jgi:pimeloyl-ACP methyl ester carboxylesterase